MNRVRKVMKEGKIGSREIGTEIGDGIVREKIRGRGLKTEESALCRLY